MTVVDDAFTRHSQLVRFTDRAMEAAIRQPASEYNRESGLIADTDRADAARAKLTYAFRDMRLRIEYLGFLDLCASFEDEFRRRAGTAIGEARKNVREHYSIPLLRSLRERLVKEAKSFDSLASIFIAVEGLISPQMQAELGAVREQRNRLSHGTNLRQPLKVTVERTRELLNELIDVLW